MPTRSIATMFFVLLLAVLVSGCSVVGGIFKAGFWTGIILVAIVAIGLMFVVAKMKG